MKREYIGFIILMSISLEVLCQTKTKTDEAVIEIDLASYCKKLEGKDKSLGPVSCDVTINPVAVLQNDLKKIVNHTNGEPNSVDQESCGTILHLEQLETPPLEVKVKDDKGNPWKIRFHFGHSRMYGSMRPTDVKIESSYINTTIKGFQFDERTSNSYYNPWKWDRSVLDAAKWIDEPSNTFEFSIENKNNSFIITAYHPKVLNTYYESFNEKGEAVYSPTHEYISNGTPQAIGAIPEGQRAIEIQNTHKYMVYQIGYGRKVNLFDGKKSGNLSIMPRVDVGVTVGSARALIVGQGQWIEKYDKFKVQGTNASIGSRLEYTRGKVGVFIEKKWTFSKNEVGFMDGKATYDLQYSPTTIGVSVDILTLKKKK